MSTAEYLRPPRRLVLQRERAVPRSTAQYGGGQCWVIVRGTAEAIHGYRRHADAVVNAGTDEAHRLPPLPPRPFSRSYMHLHRRTHTLTLHALCHPRTRSLTHTLAHARTRARVHTQDTPTPKYAPTLESLRQAIEALSQTLARRATPAAIAFGGRRCWGTSLPPARCSRCAGTRHELCALQAAPSGHAAAAPAPATAAPAAQVIRSPCMRVCACACVAIAAGLFPVTLDSLCSSQTCRRRSGASISARATPCSRRSAA